MWICSIALPRGWPSVPSRLNVMRDEAKSPDRVVSLWLPATALKQFGSTEVGQKVVFGFRGRDHWSLLGQGKLDDKPGLISLPQPRAELSVKSVCVCRLRDAEIFDAPRSEADFDPSPSGWPMDGRQSATWVEDPISGIGHCFARSVATPALNDQAKRIAAGVPGDETTRGSYIVELNVVHIGGLPGAAAAFTALYEAVVTEKRKRSRVRSIPPLPIARSYYRCEMSVDEWRDLIAEDGRQALTASKQDSGDVEDHRCIYKLWPDFKVRAQIDRSVSTIKADAARRTFEASGEGITWAVLDSGIASDHPHFGSTDAGHSLRSKEVVDLHRSFVSGPGSTNGEPIASPDVHPPMDPEKFKDLVSLHRAAALTDEFGHGTHVAGIIAGSAPEDPGVPIRVFERQVKDERTGLPTSPHFVVRQADRSRLSGVAPRCKLLSLKVLDENGEGRASDVIRALEYIRESLNDNPRLMRVHGANLSLGYEFDADMYGCGQSPLCVVVDRLVQSGVVVVAAAGNTGYGSVAARSGTTKVGLTNTIQDPGNAASAITVGSTHRDSPHTYGVSYFSSKGPTGDGRLKPDLVAPGERITSCAAGSRLAQALKKSDEPPPPEQSKSGEPPPPEQSKVADYVDDSGTSMAAPHVSGAIAAFLSIRREYIGKALDVKQIFLESATSLGRERYFEGRGMIDLMRAIQSV